MPVENDGPPASLERPVDEEATQEQESQPATSEWMINLALISY